MKNLKIRTKLFTLVIFMLVVTITVSVLALVFMAGINASSTEIAGNSMLSTILAQNLNTLTSDFRIQEYVHIISQSKDEMSAAETEMNKVLQEIEQNINDYMPLISDINADGALIEKFKASWTNYISIHNKMIQQSSQNDTQAAMQIMNAESKAGFDEASSLCLQLVEFNKDNGQKSSDAADVAYDYAVKIMIGSLLLIVLVSLAVAVYIVRSITKPVNEIDHVARKIADGQLNESINYRSKDELGVLAVNFNKTVTRLREYVNYIEEISSVLDQVADGNLVFELTYDYAGEFAKVKRALEHISDSLNDTMGQINQSADQVASGSDQVSSGAQALSQGATEQASSVEELAATINEISGQVKSNADNAIEASRKVDSLGEEIQHSNEQMQQMNKAMTEISNTSSEIGKIIKTIEDIAFQTNILALNAAVEAARAGAAGKGFAVVADEVRNLASKSAEAASNTTALIESSLKAVSGGARIADETAASLARVVDEAKEVIGTVNKISDATNEQASSVAQVTQGIDQISSVVQTNSATAEESAAASEELSGQAQVLKNLVSRFRLKNSSFGSVEHLVDEAFASASADTIDFGSKY